MKLKQVLQIQKIVEGKLPVDMHDKWVYYSNSKQDWVDILELDIVHITRIIRKHIGEKSNEPPTE